MINRRTFFRGATLGLGGLYLVTFSSANWKRRARERQAGPRALLRTRQRGVSARRSTTGNRIPQKPLQVGGSALG